MTVEELFQTIRRGDTKELAAFADVDLTLKNQSGQTFLQEAIASNQEELCLMLIQRGVPTNAQDATGQTALHFVALHKLHSVAEAILQAGGDLGLADSYGNTPLWTAVFHARGDYRIVEIFMRYRPDPMKKNHAGRSPLDFSRQIKDSHLEALLVAGTP
jgi:ankyrin repeat protein